MTAHPLIGKVVRWSHGPNVLVGPATRYDDDDDELFIVPDGLMHAHCWVPAAECVDASVLAEQGEPEWVTTTEYAYGTLGTDVIVPTGEDIDDLGTARYNAEEFWLSVLQRTVRRGPWEVCDG